MTERERLIELIRKARKETKNAICDLERVMIFADYFLANGVIVPPCKVGYYLWFYKNGEIVFGRVAEITTNRSGMFAYVFELGEFDEIVDELVVPLCEIGKTVFLTKEEAEQALKARDVG